MFVLRIVYHITTNYCHLPNQSGSDNMDELYCEQHEDQWPFDNLVQLNHELEPDLCNVVRQWQSNDQPDFGRAVSVIDGDRIET